MSINDFHLSSDKPFKPRLSSKFNDSLTYNTNLGYVRSIVVEQFPNDYSNILLIQSVSSYDNS
jgi:hypothetical protein